MPAKKSNAIGGVKPNSKREREGGSSDDTGSLSQETPLEKKTRAERKPVTNLIKFPSANPDSSAMVQDDTPVVANNIENASARAVALSSASRNDDDNASLEDTTLPSKPPTQKKTRAERKPATNIIKSPPAAAHLPDKDEDDDIPISKLIKKNVTTATPPIKTVANTNGKSPDLGEAQDNAYNAIVKAELRNLTDEDERSSEVSKIITSYGLAAKDKASVIAAFCVVEGMTKEGCNIAIRKEIQKLQFARTKPPRKITFNELVNDEVAKFLPSKPKYKGLSSVLCRVVEMLSRSELLASRTIDVPLVSDKAREDVMRAIGEAAKLSIVQGESGHGETNASNCDIRPTAKLPIVHGESGSGKTIAALLAGTHKGPTDKGDPIALYCCVEGTDFYNALTNIKGQVEEYAKAYADKTVPERDRTISCGSGNLKLSYVLEKLKDNRSNKIDENIAWVNLDDSARKLRCLIVKKVIENYIRSLAGKIRRERDVPDFDIFGNTKEKVPNEDPMVEAGTRVTLIFDEIGASMPLLHSLCADLNEIRSHVAKLLHLGTKLVHVVAVGTGGYDNRSLAAGSKVDLCTPVEMGKANRYAVWDTISDVEKYDLTDTRKKKCLKYTFQMIKDLVEMADRHTKNRAAVEGGHLSTLGAALVGNSRMAALVVEAAREHVDALLKIHQEAGEKSYQLDSMTVHGIARALLPSVLARAIYRFKNINALSRLRDCEILEKFAQAAALMHSGCTLDLPDDLRPLIISYGILTDHAVLSDSDSTGKLLEQKALKEYLVIPHDDKGPRYRLSPSHAAIYSLMCGCMEPKPLEVDGGGFEMLTAEFLALLTQAACMGCRMLEDDEVHPNEEVRAQYKALIDDSRSNGLDPFGTKKLFFALLDLVQAAGGVLGDVTSRDVVICQMSHQWQPKLWKSNGLPKCGLGEELANAAADQGQIWVLLNSPKVSGADLLVVVAPSQPKGAKGGVLHIQCKDYQESAGLTDEAAEEEVARMRAFTTMSTKSQAETPEQKAMDKKVIEFMKSAHHSYWIFKTTDDASEAEKAYPCVSVPVGTNALGPLIAVPRRVAKGMTVKMFSSPENIGIKNH